MRYMLIVLFLAGCSDIYGGPQVLTGTETEVSVATYSGTSKENAELAMRHCAQYGKKASLSFTDPANPNILVYRCI